MAKQLIISIAREYGSAGHLLAEKLSEIYNIPYYDSNLLDEIAEEKGVDAAELKRYDEVPKNRLFSTVLGDFSSSNEDNIARMQFEHMKKKADRGESFIIIGRCGEAVLGSYPCTVSLFIMAEEDVRAKRVMETDHVSEAEAYKLIAIKDRKRKNYHDNYCKGQWEDARNYDLAIDAGKLGIDKTLEIIKTYIEAKNN